MQGRHALIIFEGVRVCVCVCVCGGGVVVMWHTATAIAGMVIFILFYFSCLFETFQNALIISWNISILTFIDYVSWSSGRWSKQPNNVIY